MKTFHEKPPFVAFLLHALTTYSSPACTEQKAGTGLNPTFDPHGVRRVMSCVPRHTSRAAASWGAAMGVLHSVQQQCGTRCHCTAEHSGTSQKQSYATMQNNFQLPCTPNKKLLRNLLSMSFSSCLVFFHAVVFENLDLRPIPIWTVGNKCLWLHLFSKISVYYKSHLFIDLKIYISVY